MHMRILKSRFYYFIVFVVLAWLLLFIPRAADKSLGKVKDVVDGDTIELYDGRIVRFIGVDSPRVNVQQEGRWLFFPEPFAVEAREFNKKLLLGKSVRLEFDAEEKDQYGRLLAYCYVRAEGNKKETFVNKAMIAEGYAYALAGSVNHKHADELFLAQQQAQQEKKNIWKDQATISPREARRFINEKKIVEGKVAAVDKTRRAIHLKFHRRSKSYLQIVIFRESLVHFYRNNIDPNAFYIGKKVRVFGRIREYSGPEIVVTHPFQIELVE